MFLGLGNLRAVRAPKQNCPRCNSEQSFRPRARDTDGKPGVVEIYIRCTVCRWDQVLRKSTLEIEHLKINETRLLQKGRQEEQRYGIVKGSTSKLLQTVREEMSRMRQEAGLA